MVKTSNQIFALRKAIHELKILPIPTTGGDRGTLAGTGELVGILVNALEAIERELTMEEEGR